MKWLVQIFGDPNGQSWEISIVRDDNIHGQRSWGWFDDRKLLVSHNGGPCSWPLAQGLGPVMVEVAKRYCGFLNQGGSVEDMKQFQLEDLSTPQAAE